MALVYTGKKSTCYNKTLTVLHIIYIPYIQPGASTQGLLLLPSVLHSDNFWLNPFSSLPQSLTCSFYCFDYSLKQTPGKSLLFLTTLEASFGALFLRPLHPSTRRRVSGVTQWVSAHRGSHLWSLGLRLISGPEEQWSVLLAPVCYSRLQRCSIPFPLP